MKRFTFRMDKELYNIATNIIREKEDVIHLLLHTVKRFYYNQMFGDIPSLTDKGGTVLILIDTMSRVFFELENKIFSIAFPFTIIDDGDTQRVIRDTEFHADIDLTIIEILSDFFNTTFYHEQDYENFYFDFDDFIKGKFEDYELSKVSYSITLMWFLINKLLKFESGYLRFDHDKDNFKEYTHPLNHIDVFYSSNATFKIGLGSRLNIDDFVLIIDNNNKVYSLTK